MEEFESPRRRLRQGIRKAHQFHTGVTNFLKSNFHSNVIEFNAECKCNLHKLKVHTFPPDQLTDIVYEAIDAFRSALDQTAYACGLLSVSRLIIKMALEI